MAATQELEIGRARTPRLGHGVDQGLILARHRDEDVGQVGIGVRDVGPKQIVREEPFADEEIGRKRRCDALIGLEAHITRKGQVEIHHLRRIAGRLRRCGEKAHAHRGAAGVCEGHDREHNVHVEPSLSMYQNPVGAYPPREPKPPPPEAAAAEAAAAFIDAILNDAALADRAGADRASADRAGADRAWLDDGAGPDGALSNDAAVRHRGEADLIRGRRSRWRATTHHRGDLVVGLHFLFGDLQTFELVLKLGHAHFECLLGFFRHGERSSLLLVAAVQTNERGDAPAISTSRQINLSENRLDRAVQRRRTDSRRRPMPG